MSSSKYSTHKEGQSGIDSIKWSVDNFSDLIKQQVNQMIPNERSENSTARFELKVQFPPYKTDIFEIYYMSPYPVCLRCVLTMTTSGQTKLVKVEKECHTFAYKWQYLATINKQIINKDTSGTLKCEFKYQIMTKFFQSCIPETQLSDDFENLLNNELFSDVIIKSVEGNEYKAHKAVLASRSAVLKAHFEHNTTECHTNVIESPLEADVLQEVLTFIYSDKAPRVDEMPEKLLAAADYYQLNRLKSLCEEPLHQKLSIKNSVEILQLADLHSANTLKQLTLEFIKNSPIWLITKTEGWSKVKSVELVKNICEYITADDHDAFIKRETY